MTDDDKRLVILHRKLRGQEKPTQEYLHPFLAVYELLYGENNGGLVERAWIEWGSKSEGMGTFSVSMPT